MFSAPTTKQYGSHMVMTNVQKEHKTKYININTKFRDEFNYKLISDYHLTLSERFTDVRNITAVSAEIPHTFYNISENLQNNAIGFPSGKVLVVSDGQYNQASLIAELNKQATALSLGATFDISYNRTTITTSGTTIITLDVDASGNFAKYNFKNRLGWLLGFRDLTYTFSGKLTSEFLVDLSGPRYLYLVVDEYTGGNQKSFVSPLPTSVINKNILARIAMDNKNYGFMEIIPANERNGLLVSDTRSYTGKVDLHRLNVQLINEDGTIMNLNGADFSFCLRIEHE